MLGLLLETVALGEDLLRHLLRPLLGLLLMSVVEMGVLLPLFLETVLLSDAWTAVVTVAGTATLGEGRVLKSVAESAALGEGLLVIPLLIVLLGQLPSPVLLIPRFLFQTCSLISPFFLHSCLDFHTVTW